MTSHTNQLCMPKHTKYVIEYEFVPLLHTQGFFKVLSHTGDGESIKLLVRHEFVIWADKVNRDASG